MSPLYTIQSSVCVHRCAIVGVLRPGRKGKKVAAVKSFLMGFFAFLPIECVLAGDFSKRWENVGGNQGGKKKNRLHIDTHMLYKCHEEEKFCTVADKMVGHGLWHMDGWGEPFLAIHIFPALIPD
jgi:hypothetical protein